VALNGGGALSMARSLSGALKRLAKNYTNSRWVVAGWHVFQAEMSRQT